MGLQYSTGGAGDVIKLSELNNLLDEIGNSRPALYALVMSSVMVKIDFYKLIFGIVISEKVPGTFLGA